MITEYRTTDNVKGWHVGDAVKLFNGAFSTGTILGFIRIGSDWYADVARPYLYASDCGMPSASPLVGFETVKMVSLSRLVQAEEGRRVGNFCHASDFVLKARSDIE